MSGGRRAAGGRGGGGRSTGGGGTGRRTRRREGAAARRPSGAAPEASFPASRAGGAIGSADRPGDRPGAGGAAAWRRPRGWRLAALLAVAGGCLVVVALLARSPRGSSPADDAAGITSDAGVAKTSSQPGTGTGSATALGETAAVKLAERLRVKVVSVRPHDPTAYTQGLVWDHGTLYESAGLYGHSSLRQVNPRTGEVLRRVDVAPRYFAEGLALAGDRLIQLTWKEGVAFVYDVKTFAKVGELDYAGEGWGLCDDGSRLVMSDGSDRLGFRDRRTFALLGGVNVQLDGRPATQLNELECVDGAVYANVWTTDQILRIDPASGRVTAVVDAAGLLDPTEAARAEVLNGIAYDPEKKTFLITGKLWPKLFEVVFVPAT